MCSTPEFIFDILSDELRKDKISLLEKVATKYKLNLNELISEFIEPEEIIPKTKISINIEKKLEPRKPPTENRCMARIWGRGKGGQCTRKCCESGGEYCSQHISIRKHGRIDESVPKEKFPQKSKCLYK